ncbi:hypothetical protein ACH9EU_16065 [Kocuria sp. M1R5S2]|uniref:hypothetical protein n=1 Tax=Kocuria rhizosphaerae TaxID=3376285 RepID=UPI0037B6496E
MSTDDGARGALRGPRRRYSVREPFAAHASNGAVRSSGATGRTGSDHSCGGPAT